MSFPAPSPRARAPWRGELVACFALSWPLILTNAIEMVMNLTNVALIARLGPDELAGSTLGLALYHVCLLFGIGVTTAVTPLIARARGQEGGAGAATGRMVRQGIWTALAITAPTWMLLWFTEPVLLALGQAPALASGAATYVHTLQWGIAPLLVYLVLRSSLAALERPRPAVVVGLAGVGVNALLNVLLIGGAGPVPALGLAGSGLATVGANLFLATAMGLVAARHPALRNLHLLRGLARFEGAGLGAMWRLGLPIGVALVLEGGMFSVATAMVGRADPAALAAHAITLQIATFSFMVPLGLAQAATVRVGHAFGARSGVALDRAGWTALAAGVAAMGLAGLAMVLAPNPILDLFLPPEEPGVAAARATGVALMGIAALFQMADGAQVVLGGMLRGLQDTRTPMVVAAVGYWGIGLPLGAALAFGAGWGATGVWLGLTAGLFAVAGLLLWRWLRHPKRRTLART